MKTICQFLAGFKRSRVTSLNKNTPLIPNTKVFISYAKEDKKIAKRLYGDLKKNGLCPWMDDENLLPGQNWGLVITEAIRQSRFFVALISSNSVEKRGFFQTELKIALEILKEFPEKEVFLIPIRIDECEVPEKLNEIHYADFSKNYKRELTKLLNSFGFEENAEEKMPFLSVGNLSSILEDSSELGQSNARQSRQNEKDHQSTNKSILQAIRKPEVLYLTLTICLIAFFSIFLLSY